MSHSPCPDARGLGERVLPCVRRKVTQLAGCTAKCPLCVHHPLQSGGWSPTEAGPPIGWLKEVWHWEGGFPSAWGREGMMDTRRGWLRVRTGTSGAEGPEEREATEPESMHAPPHLAHPMALLIGVTHTVLQRRRCARRCEGQV